VADSDFFPEPGHTEKEEDSPDSCLDVVFVGPSVLYLQARFDFDLTPIPPLPALSPPGGGWDVSLWDVGVFQADSVPSAQVFGAAGTGVAMAIAMRGLAVSKTVIIGWDVVFESGGFL